MLASNSSKMCSSFSMEFMASKNYLRGHSSSKPHQLHLGDLEIRTAISCIKCSQMAGLTYRTGKTAPQTQRLLFQCPLKIMPMIQVYCNQTCSQLVAAACMFLATSMQGRTVVNHNWFTRYESGYLACLSTLFLLWFVDN